MKTSSTIRPAVKDAIIDAAIALMAVNPGATLSEIAIKAGVGRATLHRHFKGRDDLIKAIIAQCIDETESCFGPDDLKGKNAIEQLEIMFKAIIPLGDRFHFLNKESSQDPTLQKRYEAELDWVQRLVATLKKEGHIAQDVPNSWAVAQIDQLVWVAWREVAMGNVAIADAAGLAVRTLVRGLR